MDPLIWRLIVFLEGRTCSPDYEPPQPGRGREWGLSHYNSLSVLQHQNKHGYNDSHKQRPKTGLIGKALAQVLSANFCFHGLKSMALPLNIGMINALVHRRKLFIMETRFIICAVAQK